MTSRIRLPALAATLALTACGWFFDGEPDDLKRGKERTDTTPGVCPQIAGAYRNNRSDLAAMVTRMMSIGLAFDGWETVVISGHPDVAVEFVFARSGHPPDTVTLLRDRGYDCHSGWFHPDRASSLMDEIKYPRQDSPNAQPRDNRTHRFEFYITSDRNGQLVGKLEDINFDQFDVWCGDGCKGFPIPWSLRRDVHWSFLPDSIVPVAAQPQPTPADDRLAAEERALEMGPGLTSIEGWLDRAVRAAVREPISIAGTGTKPEGLHVSIVVPDSTAVPLVVARFRSLPGVRDAWEAPHYASIDPERRWHTVVMVAPDSAFILSALKRR